MLLWEKLQEYAKSGVYPMHMPGHKRQGEGPFAWYGMDITEIDGFDNLHEAQGVLKEAQERAARVMGAGQSWFLVNGSTCGILAAVFAAVKSGESVLAARNCHKAVYHALALRQAKVEWLYPPTEEIGCAGALPAQSVKDALSQKKYAACILTSPTYEGVVSDIAEIAQHCHAHGCVCIVDEAHGAHLPLGDGVEFPKSALLQGADLVIQNLHKTLPSPTQTALLSLCGKKVSAQRVEKYLSVFETSSPSYPLLAAMDACMEWAQQKGARQMHDYALRLRRFYEECGSLRRLQLVSPQGRDPGKLLVLDRKFGMTGREIYDTLKNEFLIQPEMATDRYALLMTSPWDTDEGFKRLLDGLRRIDKRLLAGGEKSKEKEAPVFAAQTETVVSMLTAMDAPSTVCLVEELSGREVSAEFVTPYPPGIPVLAPGERTGAALMWLRRSKKELRVMKKGKLFTVMGKSATGKDHIYKAVAEQSAVPLRTVVPYTTRPKRTSETEGVEYHFVTKEQMEELRREGKVIECRRYETVQGTWYYFTADDGQIDLEKGSSIVIATPDAYVQIRAYFGSENVVPIYVEVEDGERLRRAIKREGKQEHPEYKEVCRRFLADAEDFSEETLEKLGIEKRYENVDFDSCVNEILADIAEDLGYVELS